MVGTPNYRYFRAAGRSLEAIIAHRLAKAEAIEEVQSFVMLCGAERALGNHRISGLLFKGKPPAGWIRNAAAPLMAVPDTTTVRGLALARKMESLRLPDDSVFAAMIGAQPVPEYPSPSAALISMSWPSYDKLKDGWAIKCPVLPDGTCAAPPDAEPLSAAEYKKALQPTFNLLAFDLDLN